MENSLLAACLEELVTRYAVPGAQFAVRQGDTTWHWTHGVARSGTRRAMTVDAPVPVGSITKVVTAAAAMVLVDDDDLELDEPLVEAVPELRELPPGLGERITLRHVLSHTAGLPCDPVDTRALTPRRHVLDSCRTARPLSEPGTLFSYSNIGYLLAGHAVSAVTGMSWSEAVQTLVLDPLDVPARFVAGGPVPDDLVSGHSTRQRPVVQSLRPAEAAVGALGASARDLVALGWGLLRENREMRTPVPGADPFGLADGWGLGLATYGSDGATVGHDGNGDGTSCHLRMNPTTDTVVALTTNASSGFALWRDLARRLPALGIPVEDYDPLAVAGRPVPVPASCLGEYTNGDLEYAVARTEDGSLRLTVEGEPFADLTVYSGHRFTMRDCDTGVTDQAGRFVLGRDGQVTGLQVGGRIALRHTERSRLVG
jgi:CubicO group peptidase (beta-lactamase class C family)